VTEICELSIQVVKPVVLKISLADTVMGRASRRVIAVSNLEAESRGFILVTISLRACGQFCYLSLIDM